MYAKEYKAWIARKAIRPRFVEKFKSFKTFWEKQINLVNQTTVPASQYGYGMTTTTNNNYVVSYGGSITHLGALYTTTQESVKSQGTTMTQYCMALQQQLIPTNHMAQQQCGASNNGRRLA
jgi:hypothetical protein